MFTRQIRAADPPVQVLPRATMKMKKNVNPLKKIIRTLCECVNQLIKRSFKPDVSHFLQHYNNVACKVQTSPLWIHSEFNWSMSLVWVKSWHRAVTDEASPEEVTCDSAEMEVSVVLTDLCWDADSEGCFTHTGFRFFISVQNIGPSC